MYKITLFKSIRDVPLMEWNAIAKNLPYIYSTEFLYTIESSSTSESCQGYALVYDKNNHPVLLALLNTAKIDVAIFSSGWIRAALCKIRRVLPNILKIRTLECTVPMSFKYKLIPHENNNQRELIGFLGNAMLKMARDNKAFLVIIGNFEPQDDPYKPFLKDLGYQFVPCLPVATLQISWKKPDEYIYAMKSYYRSKLQRHLRINQNNEIRHEIRDEFDDLSQVLWQQWLVVHEHATEYDGEKLTPEFYKEFSLNFGSRSKVLLIYSKAELVGHALLLLDGDTLRWRNFGRAKAENDSLYIYVCHKVVEIAIKLGVKYLDMGVTTYAIKRDFGASIVPRKIAIRVSWDILNKFVTRAYPLLNHVPEIHGKDIFKKSSQ